MSRERNVRERKDVQTNSRQQEDLSRFRNVRSKPDQEKVAASDKDVQSKTCHGQSKRSHSRRPCQPGGQASFL